MRKLMIGIAILLALMVAAIAALPHLVDINSYRPRIQAELQQRTGRIVSLGRMELKVFPLRFRVENAVIGEDPAVLSTKPFAQAEQLDVSAKLLPLLRGDLQIDSLELQRPKIELIRDAQGVWNFASLGKSTASATRSPEKPGGKTSPGTPASPADQQTGQQSAQQTAGQPSSSQPSKSFSLAQLKIVDGQVAITDLQKRQPRALYDHIDLTLDNFEPGKPFSMLLAAHLPGAGNETIALKGDGGPFDGADPAATPFNGKLSLDQVSLAGLEKFINSQALQNIEFTATGDADITTSSAALSSKGNLKLENGRVNGVEIGYPITADFNVKADLAKDTYQIDRGDLRFGSAPVSISGTMNAAATPAQIDLHLKAQDAALTEIARLAAAFGVAFNPGMEIAGKLDADLNARGATISHALNGNVSARDLVINGKDLPQSVHVTNVMLTLTPQTVQSNDFVATTGSTAAHVSFAMRDYTTPSSNLQASISAPNSQLGELLNIGKAYGVSSLDGINGTGNASLDVHVQGPIKLPAQMVYSGNGQLTNASLDLPQLTKPLRIKTAAMQFSQNGVTISNAALSLGSTNATGQLTLRGLSGNAVPQVQFALNADQFNVAEFQTLMRDTPPARHAESSSFLPTAYAAPAVQPTLLSRLVGNGTVQVTNIDYDQLQMQNARSNVTLDHGLIKLAPFTANVDGGIDSGSIIVDTRPAQTLYTVNTKLDKVDANKFISSMSSVKKTIYGLLAANADASFSSGGSSSDFARTLNGNVDLDLLNGKIAHIDLLNELAGIGKFLNLNRQAQPFTNVAKLTGDFKITNGVAHTQNLVAAIEGGTLAANGDINLADQSLDLAVTAVLSKAFAQTVGGTGIGGYLSTALANSNGELVMPVRVTGTFSNPRVTPDLQRIGQMKIQQLLPSGRNPGALTTGILNSVLGGKLGGQQAGQQKPSGQNAVQGILGALGGRNSQGQSGQNQNGQQNNQQGHGSQQGSRQNAGQQNQQQPTAADAINGILGALTNKKKPPAQQPPPQPPK